MLQLPESSRCGTFTCMTGKTASGWTGPAHPPLEHNHLIILVLPASPLCFHTVCVKRFEAVPEFTQSEVSWSPELLHVCVGGNISSSQLCLLRVFGIHFCLVRLRGDRKERRQATASQGCPTARRGLLAPSFHPCTLDWPVTGVCEIAGRCVSCSVSTGQTHDRYQSDCRFTQVTQESIWNKNNHTWFQLHDIFI